MITLLSFTSGAFASKALPPGPLPLIIEAGLFIADVDGIDTSAQSYDLRLYYELSWIDKRLAHSGKSDITKPLSEIWNPNFQIVSQQHIFFHSDDEATISPDGRVTFQVVSWGSYSQALKLSRFPFDTQNFKLHIIATNYSPEEIRFVDRANLSGIANELSLADWEIVEWFADPIAYQPYGDERINVAGIVYGFKAKRLTSYYVLKMILPLMLIVAMSWAVFWMDPLNVASNVGISITSMLTLIAYRFSADAILPRLPYLTSLDYFILTSTILVFLSLLQCIATSALAKSGESKKAHSLDVTARVLFPVLFVLLTLETLIFRAII
jgi:hypothetical protein